MKLASEAREQYFPEDHLEDMTVLHRLERDFEYLQAGRQCWP